MAKSAFPSFSLSSIGRLLYIPSLLFALVLPACSGHRILSSNFPPSEEQLHSFPRWTNLGYELLNDTHFFFQETSEPLKPSQLYGQWILQGFYYRDSTGKVWNHFKETGLQRKLPEQSDADGAKQIPFDDLHFVKTSISAGSPSDGIRFRYWDEYDNEHIWVDPNAARKLFQPDSQAEAENWTNLRAWLKGRIFNRSTAHLIILTTHGYALFHREK